MKTSKILILIDVNINKYLSYPVIHLDPVEHKKNVQG